MTDRLTPGQLRDLADLIWGRDLPTPPNYLAATVQIEIAEGLRNSAARREAEGFVPEAARQAVAVAAGLTSAPPMPDAPPPPAPHAMALIDRIKFAAPQLNEGLIIQLRAEFEALRAERDKSLETATAYYAVLIKRAEAAEADAKRLREALAEARRCLLEYTEHEAGDEVSLAIAQADNALAQGGNDDQAG